MMSRFPRQAVFGLVIYGGLAGCGGNPEKFDNPVTVVTEPDKIPGFGASSAGSSPAGSEAPAATGATISESHKESKQPAAKVEGWGTLKGRVVFEGEVPKFAPVVEKGKDVKDAAVCATHEIPSEKLIVDPATKGVRNVLVYIPKPTAINPEAESEAKSQVVEFDQKGCVFGPHVIAAIKGAKVMLKSSDPVGHNVHSNLRGTPFNLGVQPGTSVPVDIKTPDNRPGLVVCDIHNWMTSWWLTLNNPYFAVTNEKGEFEIKNVPAGEQRLVVWAEATNPAFVSKSAAGDPVSIKPNDVTEVEFKFDATKVK